MSARRTGWAITIAGALVVAALTLLPRGGGERVPIACFWCDRWALQDAILNVLLFVPLGVGLGVMRAGRGSAFVVSLVATLIVEGAQLWIVPGRDPSLRDVVTNVAGGLTGHALGLRWMTLVFPFKRVAWRLAAGARLAWVVITAIGGWLLAPSLPEHPMAVIAGSHVGGFADFEGRVLRSGASATPPSALPTVEPRHRPLAIVSALIQPGPASPAFTPIVTAVDDGALPLMLAVRGDDLLLRVRTRGERIGLRSPTARFTDRIKPWYRTLPPPRDVLSVLAVRTAEHASTVVQATSGAAVRAQVPVRATQGWALLWPADHEFDDGLDMASALWCMLLVVPMGYWTACTGRHRRRLGWTLAAVATGSGFLIGPLLFSQAWPGVADVVGAILGLGIGGALGHLSRAVLRRREPAPTMPR